MQIRTRPLALRPGITTGLPFRGSEAAGFPAKAFPDRNYRERGFDLKKKLAYRKELDEFLITLISKPMSVLLRVKSRALEILLFFRKV